MHVAEKLAWQHIKELVYAMREQFENGNLNVDLMEKMASQILIQCKIVKYARLIK